jgi:hypothetical protein
MQRLLLAIAALLAAAGIPLATTAPTTRGASSTC